MEKERECQKALEREKIARGISSTRADEICLRKEQKMQMIEKHIIEQEHQKLEMMWHRVLLDDVRKKEEKERKDFERRQQEMLDRRRSYDEQIASANRKRQEAIRKERERENRKFEQIRKKMEHDHFEAITRKKEEQQTNKTNYIKGHELKMSRLMNEKIEDRKIDNGTIRVALEELRKERQRKEAEMHRLQVEKRVFTEYFNRERILASALEEEADRVAQEWKRDAENKADEFARHIEAEKRIDKEKAAKEYRKHLHQKNMEMERERQERAVKMEKVKRGAYKELEMKLDSANTELQRQIDYRNTLSDQIRNNQKVLENELKDIENKQRPFTRKADMFKDSVETKVTNSPGRKSTNPVHPFRRVIENHERKSDNAVIQLPLIGRLTSKH